MKKKIVLMIKMLILICLTLMITQNKAQAALDSFNYNYRTNGRPPFEKNGQTIYCREHGGRLSQWWGTIRYVSTGTSNLDLKTAYALSRTNSKTIRQQIIWKSSISTNKTGINPSAATIELISKGERFAEEYPKIIANGTGVEIIDENATLVSYENGQYKLGPFKLNFYKSEFSKLSELSLKTDNESTIEIKKIVDKNNVEQTIQQINSNQEFYVYCNINDAGEAKTLKMSVKYTYETASGTYTCYECKGRSNAQDLVSVDVNGGEETSTDTSKDIPLLMDLGGKVFLDVPHGKQEEDGCFANNEKGIDGIKVELFKKGDNTFRLETTTANGGYYEFNKVSAAAEYYVRFQYNGMEYENTTYQALKRMDDNGTYINSTISERSYATEGRNNRINFNAKFDPVNVNTNVDEQNQLIYAYTGRNGNESILYYSRKNSDEELKNINLGIMERPEFDLVLKKDLYSFKIKINGVEHTYIYNGRKDEAWVVKIDGSDVDNDLRGKNLAAYERKIRTVDLNYNKTSNNPEDMLQAEVTYVIKIHNESNGLIAGTVREIADYYDMDYEYISSYVDSEENTVNWQVQSDTQKYHKMTARIYRTLYSGETTKVYVNYKLNREVLDKLLTQEVEPKKNIAEITEYSTKYQVSRYDANDNGNQSEEHIMYLKGEVAGILDEDSHPGNYDPNTGANEDEDDTDMAPDLKLVLDNESVRTIEGNVFEDTALEDKLKEDNERIGNGLKDDGEAGINKVRVQLVNQDNDQVIMDTKTDDNGNYKFSNFIPGRYYIKYYYGEEEMLKTNAKLYTGQDYKSTIYDASKHESDYWYTENNRLSDAKDDWGRREDVNKYSQTLRYQNATVLNTTDTNDTSTIATLAQNTSMFANTSKMLMEVEYARTQTNMGDSLDYSVQNIDFGIIERPRAELKIDNTIAKISIVGSDSNVLFNIDNEHKANERVDNLSRIGKDLQFNMDPSLNQGAEMITTYKFVVTNIGEKDYNEQEYYYTGKVKDENNIVKSKPVQVVNYVPVNTNFYNDLEGWESNKVWDVVEDKKTQLQSDEPENLLVNKAIKLYGENNSATAKVDKIVMAETESNKLITSSKDGLKPGDSTNAEYLSIQKLITSSNDADYRFENMIEIVEAYNEVGRRYYHYSGEKLVANIPGDLDPENPVVNGELNGGQTDSSNVTANIVPPFGKQNIAYYIAGTVLIGVVLAGGIFLIKKKVLSK